MKIFSHSVRGERYTSCNDAIFNRFENGVCVVALCDGVADNSVFGARLVADRLCQKGLNETDPPNLVGLLFDAHSFLRNGPKKSNGHRYATTASVVWCNENAGHIYVSSVGDSPVYAVTKDGKGFPLTDCHDLQSLLLQALGTCETTDERLNFLDEEYGITPDKLQEMFPTKVLKKTLQELVALSEEEILEQKLGRYVPYLIGRCVNRLNDGAPIAEQEGDTSSKYSHIIMCSDGVILTVQEMVRIIQDSPDLQVACQAIIDEAVKRGSRDDCTIAIIEL